MDDLVRRVLILGGGSAGFLAAIALKSRLPDVSVVVLRSRDIGVIGVGEGSTVALYRFIHKYLGIGLKDFLQGAQPTWKLGLKFLWGPGPHFYYHFGPGMERPAEGTGTPRGFFCGQDADHSDVVSALMTHDRVFPRGENGAPLLHNALSYHFQNETFVEFLERYALARGVRILDDTVRDVQLADPGVTGLTLESGRTESADLYVDCSGFRSVLLGKALGEPFIDFKSSLYCDRAVVGGWARTDEPVKPYTTCETMNSGWCWQIEHEARVNRGYVYASGFIDDAGAEEEFRRVAPKAGPARVVRFASGRYQRSWVKNVVAIGNAAGFVEPLEATALGVIGVQSELLVGALIEGSRRIFPTQVRQYNQYTERNWDAIRAFLAVHYKFNERLDTPFWRECREKTDLGAAAGIVEHFMDCGPASFWEPTLFEPMDPFKMAGYAALLIGQRVPYRRQIRITEGEGRRYQALTQRNRQMALNAFTIPQVLATLRQPGHPWPEAVV
jgi:tryptophan halogenase